MITQLDPSTRLDLFEPGDQTALVCLDVPEMQRLVVEQLGELKYKLHTGLSVDDILLKMRSHTYDVIVLSAHFNATMLETNPVYLAANSVPPSQRRRQVLVLIGSQFSTANEMQAFTVSADLIIGLSDVVNFCPILRRAAQRHLEFYTPYHEAEKAGRAA